MPRNPFVLPAALLLALTACGGSSVTDPMADNDLSAEETARFVAAVQESFTQANAAKSPAGSTTMALAMERSRYVAIPSGKWLCPAGGHVTWTGNDNSSYDPDTGITYIATAIKMQYGDPTNNLNDCAVVKNDLILDGSLNLIISGKLPGEGVGAMMNGTISINRRGPTGGLVPRGSCWIFLEIMRGTTKVTGTVCGRSVT